MPKNKQNFRYSVVSKNASSGMGQGTSQVSSNATTNSASNALGNQFFGQTTKMKRPWEKSFIKKKLVDLCILGAFEIIGDLEVVCDLPNYLSSVYCTECGDIYEVNRDDFLRLLQKKNPDTYDKIKAFTGHRVEVRSGRLKRQLYIDAMSNPESREYGKLCLDLFKQYSIIF